MSSLRARWTAVRLALVILLASPLLLPAQSTGGRIVGRVSDQSGAVLANVQITLVNDATGVSNTAQSSDSGDYGFPQVSVGTYHLEFGLTGFKKEVRRSITVDL